MQRRHRPAGHAITGIEVMPAAAKFEDSACLTQKRFSRSAAEKKDAVRVRQLNVAAQPWHQDIHLLVCWGPVAGWPPGNQRGDIGVSPAEPNRSEHPVEELAGGADKRAGALAAN